MSPQAKGYLTALIGITVWSTTGVFMSHLIVTYHIPAFVLALWRNLLVCVALLPVLLFVNRTLLRIKPINLSFYGWYGFVLALLNTLWALSVQANGAAVATVLVYSSAGFTAIFAIWIFKERLGIIKGIAILLSLAGCVMVSNAYNGTIWHLNPLGVITGILSGVIFAIYTLMGKESAKRQINTWNALFYSFALGAIWITIFNLWPGMPGSTGSYARLWPDLPLNGWLILLMLAIIPTLLGFGLYNTSMNYLSASIANLLATLEPAMTAVQAYIFLDERMSVIQIVGSLIIILAVFIVQIEKQPHL
ncbi:DMT family transporter [Candidatus Oscillochloris fontis]|uniref:DMT family transporter n=1 Tax=Candidatus Oscillochloris fontis TaxID=2496868 RepID=UPI00101E1EA0|nr:EamA family transporter [Candidatus Oscillochloris fontis]